MLIRFGLSKIYVQLRLFMLDTPIILCQPDFQVIRQIERVFLTVDFVIFLGSSRAKVQGGNLEPYAGTSGKV